MTTVIKKRAIAKKSVDKVECKTLKSLLDNLDNKISFKSLVDEFNKQLLKNGNSRLIIGNVIFNFKEYLDSEFNCDDLEELKDYFQDESDISFLNFSFDLSPYTCGIAEIGEYSLKIPTNKQSFLEFLVIHSCTGHSFGMLTTTFVDRDANHSDFRKLLEEFLPADTKIHFKNPKTRNALTTYIWI